MDFAQAIYAERASIKRGKANEHEKDPINSFIQFSSRLVAHETVIHVEQ